MTTFLIHVDPADAGLVWWAESPDVAGLSVAAPSLKELRRLIDEAVELHVAPGTEIQLQLVGAELEAAEGEAWDSGDGSPSVGTTAPRSVHVLAA